MKVHSEQSSVLRYLLTTSLKDRRFVKAVCFAPCAAFLLQVALPYLMSRLLASLAQGRTESITQQDYALLSAVLLLGVLCNRITFKALFTAQAYTLTFLENITLKNLLGKSNRFFENNMSGKLTSDAFQLGESLALLQNTFIIQIVPFATTMLAGSIILLFYAPVLSIGILILNASIIGAALTASRYRRPLRKERREAQRDVRGHYADAITNQANVRLIAQEKTELNIHSHHAQRLLKFRLKDWLIVAREGNYRIAFIYTLQIVFVYFLIQSVQASPQLLAGGIFAFAYTITLSSRLFEMNGIINGIENAVTNAEPMVRILQSNDSIKDPPHPKAFHVHKGAISFTNVRFAYQADGAQELFENLTLHIEPGEKVGLVGPSGGGKTTITKLLLRIMDIQEGEISIDGQNIAQSRQTDVRTSIGYVPQEPLLFHRSIKDNIGYGRPGANLEAIMLAAQKAHADEFIQSLPNGYDTLVGERGVKLSGGQRQRIAIARAILKNAPILILDEATSALDSESEVLIQDALWKLMEQKTAIVIAHRLSTIQKMDRIVVLDKGMIVEEGTHDELLKRKHGLYRKLWQHQSGGFLGE